MSSFPKISGSALPYVSMPVEWDELIKAKNKGALCFSPEEALHQLQRVGDLFKPVLQLNQNVPLEAVVLRAAREQHLEGVIAKHTDSIYRPGVRSVPG